MKNFLVTNKVLIIISGMLAISLVLNVVLFQQAFYYYANLSLVHLDPNGISLYPGLRPSEMDSSKEQLVVLFGDSRIVDWLPRKELNGVRFVNRGIGGNTSTQAQARFSHHTISLKPSIVVLQVGINDLKAIDLFPDQESTIVNNCESNIHKIIEMAKLNNTKIVLTTIILPGHPSLVRRFFWSEEISRCIYSVNEFIRTLKSEQVTILDAAALLSKGEKVSDANYMKDFLHVNADGYRLLDDELFRILENELVLPEGQTVENRN